MTRQIAVGLVGVTAAIAVPSFASDYWVFVVTLVMIYALAGLGMTVLTGWTGQIALAVGGFMGIGAYGTALISQHGVPWPVAFILASLCSAAAGCIVGLPSVRLEGFYLAIATLAFGELIVQILSSWSSVTGGPAGMTIGPVQLLGLSIVDSTYVISLIVVAPLFALVAFLGRGFWGRRLKVVRDMEAAAGALGISANRQKLIAFGASAALAGAAGGLFGQLLGFISPPVFDIPLVIQLLVVAFLGGIRYARGPLLGAIVVVALRQELQPFGAYQTLAYGLLLLSLLLVLPSGVASIRLEDLRNGALALRRRAAPRIPAIPEAPVQGEQR